MVKKHFILHFSLIIAMLFLLAGNTLALDKLEELLTFHENIVKLLPTSQAFNGKAFILGGKATFPFTQTIDLDDRTQTVNIEINSGSYRFTGRLDQSLRLTESVSVFKDKELIKFLGHDRRVTEYDQKHQKLIIKYFLNSQEKKTKVISYDYATVDSDTLYLFLQAMLLRGVKNFNSQIILNGRGMRLNNNFKLVTTNDLQKLEPAYTFPDKYKQLAKGKEEYYVFITELTGAPHVVFPYKYYYAFRKTPPYKLIAYWGGDPQEAEFYFAN